MLKFFDRYLLKEITPPFFIGLLIYSFVLLMNQVFLLSELFIARVTSHIPDKGQVTVRYFGLYANAHRGKVKKARLGPFPLRIVEDELRRLPSKGWAEMIRKVYEVGSSPSSPTMPWWTGSSTTSS